MSGDFPIFEPYGVKDLSDFDTLSNSDEYYPFSKENMIIDEKVVLFMLRIGYIFDYSSMGWYQLNYDGLFYEVTEDEVKRDIMRLLNKRAPSGVNIPLKNTQSILERLRSCSFDKSCREKYDNFLLDHSEYEIPYGVEETEIIRGGLIPVKNGVINPATMELLPHCGYLLHHNIYNFNFQKLTEDEIKTHPAWDIYAEIIPDIPTLELFLWWVGMVLFSPELPRVLMVLYGNAGTGKTTLSLGLSKILTPARSLQLNLGAFKNSRFITSSFADKQLIVIDEMSNSAGLLDDALFKQLTGGTPNFTIEEKYKSPRNVALRSKFLLIGNSYPAFLQDGAIYDRLFIIPCPNKQDKSVRLLVVQDDILNWLFNAGHLYYNVKRPHDGVKYVSQLKTPLMIEELGHYRDTDAFNYWIKDYLEIDDITIDAVQRGLDKKRSKTVYEDYQRSLLEDGNKPLSSMKFNEKLRRDFGLEKVKLRDGLEQYKGYQIIKED